MQSFKTQDQYIREIADKLNKAKFVNIKESRPITIKDIEQLRNDKILTIPHSLRTFNIEVRKKYIVDYVLNIPTLLYSEDNYMVADNLMGVHPVSFNAEDTVEFVNGLLGY